MMMNKWQRMLMKPSLKVSSHHSFQQSRTCCHRITNSFMYTSSQRSSYSSQTAPPQTNTPPKLIVFVGPPASGKGTQVRLLQKHFPKLVTVVSAEDTLRQASKSNDKLNEILKRGELAPRDLTDHLLQESILNQSSNFEEEDHHQEKKIIILEGYPRDVEQAKLFLTWFSDKKLAFRKSHVLVIHLLSDKANIMQRLQGRLIHPASGRPYHSAFNPPKSEMVDDVTGEPLIKRDDDADKSAIAKRLSIYKDETLPMIDFLSEHDFDVIDIAQGELNEVYQQIEKTLIEKELFTKEDVLDQQQQEQQQQAQLPSEATESETQQQQQEQQQQEQETKQQ